MLPGAPSPNLSPLPDPPYRERPAQDICPDPRRGPVKIKPWMAAVLGVVLNVVSAGISNNLIDAANKEIAAINREQTEAQQAIDDLWKRIQDSERKKDALMVLRLLGEDHPGIGSYVERELEPFRIADPRMGEAAEAPEIVAVIEVYQRVLRDDLDSAYLGTVGLQERRDALESDISVYRNIALFLQILGLILVLGRDEFPG